MSLWCELCGWSPADDTEEELFHVRHVYRGGQLCPECGMGRLELTRADVRQGELSQAEAFARLLASFLPEIPAEKVPGLVMTALPWTRYLTGAGRAEFVNELPAVLEACVGMETLAPLETYLAEWRDTAAAQADPAIRDMLIKPIHSPMDMPVPVP